MRKKLDKSISEAVSFVRDNYKNIEGACGFPEISGRDRITEWGGTISGMHVVKPYVTQDDLDKGIFNNSLNWINSKQDASGGWDTGGICISESTSDVLYYLLSDECGLTADKQRSAVEFIKSNYKSQGYFTSTKQSTEGRIYTTYLSVRALLKANQLIDKKAISLWILGVINNDKMWGESFRIKESRIAQTIYALNILKLCGSDWSKIRKEYERQIKWIFNQLYNNRELYSFEEYSIPTKEKDDDGQKYKRIRVRHSNLPLAINLLLNTGYTYKAIVLSEKLINKQSNGGWGISETELTMWGTQQSLDAIKRIEGIVLNRKCWKACFYIEKIVIYLNQNKLKAFITFVILTLAVLGRVLNFMPDFASGIAVGIIANSLTGYFKNWKSQ